MPRAVVVTRDSCVCPRRRTDGDRWPDEVARQRDPGKDAAAGVLEMS